MVFSKADVIVTIGLLLLVICCIDSSTTVSNSSVTTSKPNSVSDSNKINTSTNKSLLTSTTGKPPSTATFHTNATQQPGVTKSNVTSTQKPKVTSSLNDSSVTKAPSTTKPSASEGSKGYPPTTTVQSPGKSVNGSSSVTTKSVGNGTTNATDQSTTPSTASTKPSNVQPSKQSSTPHEPVTPQTQNKTVTGTKSTSNTSLSTPKTENRPSSTQKTASTSTAPTPKPGGSHSTPTQNPVNTSTPEKPGTTFTPTQTPENVSTPTQKPDNTSAPTQNPGKTSNQTQKPDNTSTPTQKPDNTSNPTQNPTKTPVSTGQQSPQTSKPTLPPRHEFVYINEIMLDKNGGFQKVELLLSKKLDVKHYTMVMVDGLTNKIMSTVSLKDMVIQKNGLLLVVTFNTSQTSPSMKDQGTGVAIYDTSMTSMKEDWTVSETGLVDALVIGKTYTGVSEHLTDILTPGVNPFILDPNKYGNSKTISRCSSERRRNTDMFALINPSFGVDNSKKCKERFLTSSNFAIKIKNVDCSSLEDSSLTANKFQLTVKKLIHYLVKRVNMECQCGITQMHIIDPKIHCCDGASVDMRFVAPNKDQLTELKDSYISFLNKTNHVNVNNHLYPIDNSCYENCCHVTKHPHSKPQASDDDTAKNVKVTVAVIVSCLIVFMIIVIVVIMYMRRKKSAVYQFRMSRLDEEDDLVIDGPDQDDFVGGQEATFDVHGRYQ